MLKKWTIIIILLSVAIYSVSVKVQQEVTKKHNDYHEDFTLSGDGCLVLNYHRVRTSNRLVKVLDKLTVFYTKDAELYLYSVYKDDFENQLMYLKDEGFDFITPDQLNNFFENEIALPNKCALVTFDDVDVSVYENAYPFLLENQIPFTLFIITGEMGNPDFKGLKLATWDQIKEMNESGLVTIGSHTHQMHFMDKDNNPPFLNLEKMDEFEHDTKLVTESFEENLGFTPIYYAYPYGFGMPETDQILKENGYELLFTLRPGLVEKGDSPYFIKRVLVSKKIWPKIVEWGQTLTALK